MRTKEKRIFEEYEIATIIQQVLQAIEYLHSKKIVHRDIKPENIVFCKTTDLRIKLIDLGLVNALMLFFFVIVFVNFQTEKIIEGFQIFFVSICSISGKIKCCVSFVDVL